ncbi:MAG: LamG-like jellyroll fold domain-containing protein [Bacteroidota bacterium]
MKKFINIFVAIIPSVIMRVVNRVFLFPHLVMYIFFTINIYAQAPSAFNLISPTNGACANARPTFVWQTATGAIMYNIWIDTGNGLQLIQDNILTTYYQPNSTHPLSEGFHAWCVYAFNNTGGDYTYTQSTQTFSVNVDSTPPTPFDLLRPLNMQWTNSVVPTFQWTASPDNGCGGFGQYWLMIDGSRNNSSYNVATTSLQPYAPYGDLRTGSHTWYVVSYDGVSNVRHSNQTWTVRVDNIPPTGSANQALSCDGNGYVKVMNRSTFNVHGLTIEAWVNIPQHVGSDEGVIAVYPIYALGQNRYVNGNISFVTDLNHNNEWQVNSNDAIPLNTWTHIAATWDGGTVIFYLNGAYDGTINGFNISQSNDTTVAIKIGGNGWVGKIDEVRVWNIVRQPQQIGADMNHVLSGNETGLIGYWRFNEGYGTMTIDRSPYGNTGTLVGSASFTADSIPWTDLGTVNLILPTQMQYLNSLSPACRWQTARDIGVGFQKYQFWVDGSLQNDNLVDTSFTISRSLTYGKHTWYVKAFDSLGNNQTSEIGVFNVDNAPPNPFSLVSPHNDSVFTFPTPEFQWQTTTDSAGGGGLSKYQLWIDGYVNVDSIASFIDSTAPNSPLAEGPHQWFVKAYDQAGNSRSSNRTFTVFVDLTPPLLFSLVYPNNNDTSIISRPSFVWHMATDVGSGIARYQLSISGQPSIVVYPPDTSAKPLINLSNGKYTWSVVAYDYANHSRQSITDTLIVNVLPPLTPNLLFPRLDSTGFPIKLTLKWNTAAGADAYHLQVSPDSGFTIQTVDDSTLTDTFHLVGPLAYHTKYFWRVKSSNSVGSSTYSSVWDFITLNIVPSFTSRPDTIAHEDSLYQYQAAASDSDGDNLTFTLMTKPSWLSWNSNGSLNGTPAVLNVGDTIVAVQVTDDFGGSAIQQWNLHVHHTNHAPGAVFLLSPANGDTIKLFTNPQPLTFKWNRSVDVDSQDTLRYIFYVKGPSLDTLISNLMDTVQYFNIMSRLQTASNYKWTVLASDGILTIASHDTFGFRTSNTVTGIHDKFLSLPTKYTLDQNYPNPFNPTTTISYALPQPSRVRLTIVNTLGQELFILLDQFEDTGYKSVSFDASKLPSGVYFYRMEAGGFFDVKKLLLMK